MDHQWRRLQYHTPTKKLEKILQTLKKLDRCKAVKVNDFQKLQALFTMPQLEYSLSALIWRAITTTNKGWTGMIIALKGIFKYFKWLFKDIVYNPINVGQSVLNLPRIHGYYMDTCKHAASGVWIIPKATGYN